VGGCIIYNEMKHLKGWKLFESHVIKHEWDEEFYSLYRGCCDIVASEVPLGDLCIHKKTAYHIVYNNVYEFFHKGKFPVSEQELIWCFECLQYKREALQTFEIFKSAEGEAGVERILEWARKWKALGHGYEEDPDWLLYVMWTRHFNSTETFRSTKVVGVFGKRISDKDLDSSVLDRFSDAQKDAWSYMMNVEIPESFDADWVDV
jgi:hypothetical protein